MPLTIGVSAVVIAAAAGLLVGPADIDVWGVLLAIADVLPLVDIDHGLTQVEHTVLFEIRFPRVVLGGLVGAILAVAGAAYQGVFRNPLADPYLLGVAAGAGLGATVAFGTASDSDFLALFAFAGGLVAVAITYSLGRSVGGRTTTSLILAGVAVAAFATAVQTYVLQRNTETLREVYSWILGRLVTVGWSEVVSLLPYAVVASAVLLGSRRLLDVLGIGDEEASALGLDVGRVRWVVVVAATLATAAAVSVSGLIGFVGIIVPHTVRILFGWSYRVIVPLSLLFGAAFLMFADVAARTVVSPAELPIGVVTAFFGAPFFVLVLRTMRGVR
ncbi:MAG: iron ABC transporter permease [Actinobacteria bacterium]|nr:iron ABC transporter permease [Actinomycetota bacterium]MCZ6740123.1 iron ABC transporter permease [Actinomycetota bacterium]